MLGAPASPGVVGWALIAVGLVVGVAVLVRMRGVLGRQVPSVAAAIIALVVTAAATPYVVWRITEDVRYTTSLHGYDRAAAGPVQAYLPGYLVDGAARLIPRTASYATVVSPSVPWLPARTGFGPLTMESLFPRRSVANARDADYLVTWGVRPASVVSAARVWTLRKAFGQSPTIYVAKVRH
ncbi:MAG TPA: hypothetical protein VH538_11180 [Gaiellaceae bacterium]